MATSCRPEGFPTLSPHIVVSDGNAAMDFYQKAFGAEELTRMHGPDGQSLMHGEVRIGGSPLMIAQEWPGMTKSPQTLGGTAVALAIYVEDCDAAFQKAVEAGATPAMPPSDMFWGDRYSKVVDPFGHEWEISTHKEDLTPEQIGERAAEFFKNMPPGGDCAH